MNKHQEIIELDDDDDDEYNNNNNNNNNNSKNNNVNNNIFQDTEEQDQELFREYNSPVKTTSTTTTTTSSSSKKVLTFDSDTQTPQKSITRSAQQKPVNKKNQNQQQKQQPQQQDIHNIDSDSDTDINTNTTSKLNNNNNNSKTNNNNNKINNNSKTNNNNSKTNNNNNNNNNNITINDTPIKRKSEQIDEDEKKKKKKKQKSNLSNGQTSITEFMDKSKDSDIDYSKLTDESLVNSDDEKEFETTFTIGSKSTSKKPVPPTQKKSNTTTTTTTTTSTGTPTRKRTTKYSLSETKSYLTYKPKDSSGEEEEEEEYSSSDSDKGLSSSSSSSYSYSSSSTSSYPSKSKSKEKKEKVTEKTLRKEAYISFDNSFKSIINHKKDMIEPLKNLDVENIEYRDNGIDYSIRFTRKKDNKEVMVEKFIIIFIPVEVFVDLVRDNKAIDYIKSIKDKNPNANHTLLIESLDQYLKNRIKEAKEKFQKNMLDKSAIDTRGVPDRSTINKLFIDIQLTFGFTIKTIEERSDVISILSKFYELVAKRPLRSESSLFKGFCAESIKKRTKDISLTEVWCNQLCQIAGISSNIARCIVNIYPTISSLYKRFNSLSTPREKELALKDLMLETPSGQKRKLGEVLSIRIYNIFNSTDPKKIVNI